MNLRKLPGLATFACALFALAFGECFLAQQPAAKNASPSEIDPGLIAHEWGTFTSIAGDDGSPVRWQPLSGTNDLPGFVEHFRTASFKLGLAGTVRMETPVLYFYSTHRATVSVHVAFSKGLITEWYPHADSVTPSRTLTDASLYDHAPDGSIAWNSLTVDPDATASYPREGRASHYYAARETNASPLLVNYRTGTQAEKFLFYRGVSASPVPLSVRVLQDGRLLAGNLSGEAIPQAILFERRGEKIRFRPVGAIQNSSIVTPPELNSDMESISTALEEILAVQGLYREEAHAMVETWQDSWFEEGTRLLYIVPRSFVDGILPLTIRPLPAATVRVFVGRLEIVTPATQNAIEQALASQDRTSLARYGRFLEPILQIMLQRSAGDTARTRRLRPALDSVYGQLLAEASVANRVHPSAP